ncbi:MAG: outer membrane beta-barrel protein [Acidobacteriaceae bacterium]|nr:outer membrane beta-barrel protein [Acidobacteriaceae bacterium]
MKYAILAGVVSLGLFVTGAQAQEGYNNEITVSAFGSFQKGVTGNGVDQTAEHQPGVLATYRYYFRNNQALEFDYGFSRYNQQFTGAGSTPLNLTSLGLSGTSLAVPTDTHEGTLSYVYRFGTIHHLRPFVSAGGGVLVFSPSAGAFGTGSSTTFVTPDFVYSAGADVPVTRRVSLRLGYRGHVFQAPGFGIAEIKTGSVTHMAEPFAGLSFHF